MSWRDRPTILESAPFETLSAGGGGGGGGGGLPGIPSLPGTDGGGGDGGLPGIPSLPGTDGGGDSGLPGIPSLPGADGGGGGTTPSLPGPGADPSQPGAGISWQAGYPLLRAVTNRTMEVVAGLARPADVAWAAVERAGGRLAPATPSPAPVELRMWAGGTLPGPHVPAAGTMAAATFAADGTAWAVAQGLTPGTTYDVFAVAAGEMAVGSTWTVTLTDAQQTAKDGGVPAGKDPTPDDARKASYTPWVVERPAGSAHPHAYDGLRLLVG